MSKRMKVCKSCEKEVAKSAKKCPNCGQKLKMGFIAKCTIFWVVVIGVVVIASPSAEEKAAAIKKSISELNSSQVSQLSPVGELAEIFKTPSKYTDLQRENKKKEITGKVIHWKLPVYEVEKKDEGFVIECQSKDAIFGGIAQVGASITVYPQNDADIKVLENTKTGDTIQFKGKINGFWGRTLEIEPAILTN